MTAPRVLVMHAPGTNRDREAAVACSLAGGDPEVVHLNMLASGARRLSDYHLLVLPGGFSYGDDLGAGRLWANDLYHRFSEELQAFIAAGKPVLGICNGFQALVKAGYLPGPPPEQRVTLTFNRRGRFECRWVLLQPVPESVCLFTRDLPAPIYCPVAHGEGRLVARDEAARQALWSEGLVALQYVGPDGAAYPHNPNGSVDNIAGICNAAGNVLGLMPHPEDHIMAEQHPRWSRGEGGGLGIHLFRNGVRAAAEWT